MSMASRRLRHWAQVRTRWRAMANRQDCRSARPKAAPIAKSRIVLGYKLAEERRLGPGVGIPLRGDEILCMRNVAARRAHAVRLCTASTE